MKNKTSKIKSIYIFLFITYFITLLGMILWNGRYLLFLAFQTYGFLIIFGGLPIKGILLLYRSKTIKTLIWGILCNFTILIPYMITISSLPLRTSIKPYDDSILTPKYVSVLILLGGFLFIIATLRLSFSKFKCLPHSEKLKVKSIYSVLSISYGMTMLGIFLWNGAILVYYSIYSLGIPIIFLGLPIKGMLLLFRSKTKKTIMLGTLLNLTIFLPYILTIFSLPLRTSLTTHDSSTSLTPSYVAVFILLGGSVFIISTLIAMFSKIKELRI
ncbi:hypothetical protein [Lactococcus garvieae]